MRLSFLPALGAPCVAALLATFVGAISLGCGSRPTEPEPELRQEPARRSEAERDAPPGGADRATPLAKDDRNAEREAPPEERDDQGAHAEENAAARQELALTERERLTRLADALAMLLRGELPVDANPQELFEVDLANEEAVAVRRAELEEKLTEALAPTAAETEAATAISDPTEKSEDPRAEQGPASDRVADPTPATDRDPISDDPVAGDPVAGDPVAGDPVAGDPASDEPAPGRGQDGELVSDGGVERRLDEDSSLDADGTPNPGADSAATSASEEALAAAFDPDLVALELRVDRLRLEFLALPAAVRQSTLASFETAHDLSLRADVARATEAAAAVDHARAYDAQERAQAEARGARSSDELALAQSRLALAEMRAEIARLLGAAARQRREETLEEATRLQTVHEARTALSAGHVSTEDADALYDRLVSLLVATRSDLRRSLVSADVAPLPALPVMDADTSGALNELIGETRSARSDAEASIRSLEEERVSSLARALHEANELRLDLLSEMPAHRRVTLRGWGHEGRAQLVRELEQLELMSRATLGRLARELPTWPATVLHLSVEPETRGDVFWILAFVAAGVFAYRRRRLWLVRLESRWRARIEGLRQRRRLNAWWQRLVAASGPLVVIITTLIVFRFVRSLLGGPEAEMARTLILAFAAYRLFVQLLHHELTARARHLDTEYSERIRPERAPCGALCARQRCRARRRSARGRSRNSLRAVGTCPVGSGFRSRFSSGSPLASRDRPVLSRTASRRPVGETARGGRSGDSVWSHTLGYVPGSGGSLGGDRAGAGVALSRGARGPSGHVAAKAGARVRDWRPGRSTAARGSARGV